MRRPTLVVERAADSKLCLAKTLAKPPQTQQSKASRRRRSGRTYRQTKIAATSSSIPKEVRRQANIQKQQQSQAKADCLCNRSNDQLFAAIQRGAEKTEDKSTNLRAPKNLTEPHRLGKLNISVNKM